MNRLDIPQPDGEAGQRLRSLIEKRSARRIQQRTESYNEKRKIIRAKNRKIESKSECSQIDYKPLAAKKDNKCMQSPVLKYSRK